MTAVRLAFLGLPVEERRRYLSQAALGRAVQVPIMEKDFWVCWLLGVLFSLPGLGEQFVFKGGTSLSKVALAIDRFSEDIDVSLAPELLGIEEDEVEAAGSRAQRDRWTLRLVEACARVVSDRVQPALEAAIEDVLGPRAEGTPWLEARMDDVAHSPVMFFHYPTIAGGGYGYIARSVKLEFGSLTDQRPVGRHRVTPWVAEEIPTAFEDWRCEVVALEVERTFWEKATILHSEAHRAPAEPMPARYSRHYSDLAALAKRPVAELALARVDLRERVVSWKGRFFARAWARYDLAVPGSFKLVPPDARIQELAADYASMRDMFLKPPAPFSEVIETLAALEARINSGGAA